MTKEDLIESILMSPEQDGRLLGTLTATLCELVSKVAELKKAINSPDNTINEKFLGLQAQVYRQVQLITKQQRFLVMLDQRKREKNLVTLGVPDKYES